MARWQIKSQTISAIGIRSEIEMAEIRIEQNIQQRISLHNSVKPRRIIAWKDANERQYQALLSAEPESTPLER